VTVPRSKSSIRICADSNFPNAPIRLFCDDVLTDLNQPQPLKPGATHFSIEFADSWYHLSVVQSDYSTTPHLAQAIRITAPDYPQINCPQVVGARSGRDFLFLVATTGALPIQYSASGLPSTLKLDSSTGIITGTAPDHSISFDVTATNSFGSDKVTITVTIGDRVRLTPPMAWNSWYAESEAISDPILRNVTLAFISHGLPHYGWTYINIDDCWQGPRSPDPPYPPTGKRPFSVDGKYYGGFTDMHDLTNYIHSFGLKAGIYSGPKLSSYAGFIASSSNNISGRDYSSYSPNNGNTNARGPVFDGDGNGTGHNGNPGVNQPSQFFGRSWSGYENSPGARIGQYWFGDIDTQQFADWRFDYVKWDWSLNANYSLTRALTQAFHDAIVKSNRDIVLSLSNNVADVGLMNDVKALGADVVRNSGDIRDNWNSLSTAANAAIKFLDSAGGGFWPDPDMLQVGYIGVPNGLNTDFHKTNLDENAQYFQLSLWTILPAPLLLSGDLNQLDDFTVGLLTNREVIAVNQDALGLAAKLVGGAKQVLAKKLYDGSVAVGVFNYETSRETQVVDFEKVSQATGVDLSKGATVRGLWEQKDIGMFKDSFQVDIDATRGALYRLIPVQ
jgi:alpha-galactosidase